MKKKHLRFLLLCAFLSGCHSDTDYVYRSYYEYINNSSAEIRIESYYYHESGIQDSIFTIPRNGTFRVGFETEGDFLPPFSWSGIPGTLSSAVVHQGNKRIEYEWKNNGAIYMEENYDIVEKSKYRRVLSFTFKDDDFVD
ncbi:DUF4968 domain-containing protein [Alistipes sp. OttesenSCG-928-B03]|nr:DUF4968 domain-containing protein [Alistipes sp. OttesenSCG-928-B03]